MPTDQDSNHRKSPAVKFWRCHVLLWSSVLLICSTATLVCSCFLAINKNKILFIDVGLSAFMMIVSICGLVAGIRTSRHGANLFAFSLGVWSLASIVVFFLNIYLIVDIQTLDEIIRGPFSPETLLFISYCTFYILTLIVVVSTLFCGLKLSISTAKSHAATPPVAPQQTMHDSVSEEQQPTTIPATKTENNDDNFYKMNAIATEDEELDAHNAFPAPITIAVTSPLSVLSPRRTPTTTQSMRYELTSGVVPLERAARPRVHHETELDDVQVDTKKQT